MDSAQLEAVTALGENLLSGKRYILAFNFLWLWDYALTFEDEVNYFWKGKKSWAFGLFLLNRYWPLPYIIWILFAFWWPGYSQKACDKTAFVETMFFSFATLFAQTALTLRVYAVTGKNKLLTAIPACICLSQFIFGFYVWVVVSKSPSRHWPPIPLDAYHLCVFKQEKYQEAVSMSFSLVYDLLAFLIIIRVGSGARRLRRSGIPTILDRIVKDATVYFLVIFTSHFIGEIFILFAPHNYRLLPASSNAILVPLMATRLMLSLKKAAGKLGAFMRTEDLDVISEAIFVNDHTTMEQALELDVSRRPSQERAGRMRSVTFDLRTIEHSP